jgi:hypothetical protein
VALKMVAKWESNIKFFYYNFCHFFQSQGKIQPFNVSISSSALVSYFAQSNIPIFIQSQYTVHCYYRYI